MPYASPEKRAECVRVACRRYYRRHHIEQLERARAYREQRQSEDPTFRVRRALQTNLRARLKLLGIKHPPSLKAMLGCSWSFFWAHIQSQFEPGWDWDGYGTEWQLHHLRPFADFDFRRKKESLCLVNHWTNMRPLNPGENLARGDCVRADDIRQVRAQS